MDRFIKNIDQQIAHNQGKNIFADDLETFQFISETVRTIASVDELDRAAEQLLIDYAADKAIEERSKFTTANLITGDWLAYDYGMNKWGTIVSHLGFSNHFNHHHLRSDGNYLEYGKTYMKILHSLKVGGSFHYAPDLPYIEPYLDSNQFSLQQHDFNEYEVRTTIVKKLK